MKRYAEPVFVVLWVALVITTIQLARRAPCPGEHHEPRINQRIVSQQP